MGSSDFFLNFDQSHRHLPYSKHLVIWSKFIDDENNLPLIQK